MKENERQGTVPKKVGYLKFLRLQKKELGEKHTIDDYFAFEGNISRAGCCISCIVCRIGSPIRSIGIRSNT